jgi:hypothetical protein
MKTKELTFHEKLVSIQSELKAPKNQYNKFGKYNYRSCEDILEAVKPLLKKYELALFITDEIKEVSFTETQKNKGEKNYNKTQTSGLCYVSARAILRDASGGVVETSAQAGIQPNRKGMDVSQSFGASSSYARKYALNGMFLIDDTKDADVTNTHGKTLPKEAKKTIEASGESFEKAKAYIEKNGKEAINVLKENYNISQQAIELLTNL